MIEEQVFIILMIRHYTQEIGYTLEEHSNETILRWATETITYESTHRGRGLSYLNMHITAMGRAL